jgi:hypothetical protein
MAALVLENYSEKAILLKGDKTKEFKENIKSLGGKWNSTLKGWIFPKTKEPEVRKFIDQVNTGDLKPLPHHSFDVINIKDELETISLQQQKSSSKAVDNSISSLTIFKKLLEMEKELLAVKTELLNLKNTLGKLVDEDEENEIENEGEDEVEGENEESYESSEEELPPKRLIKRK